MMSDLTYRYFTVRPEPPPEAQTYHIINPVDGEYLGSIKWHGPWRQFCFFPACFKNTVWSTEQLDDIQDALERITEVVKDE